MNSIDITSFRTGRNTLTVRQLASEHIADIDAKIRRFRSLRNELRNLLSRRAAVPSDESIISSRQRMTLLLLNQFAGKL